MATNINSVTLTGYLCADPERVEQASLPLTKFRIGVNGVRKDKDGSQIDDPNFVNIVTFNGVAGSCEKYLNKGSRVAVQGRLNWSEWQTNDGQRRESLEVIANSVEFLSPPKETEAPITEPDF